VGARIVRVDLRTCQHAFGAHRIVQDVDACIDPPIHNDSSGLAAEGSPFRLGDAQWRCPPKRVICRRLRFSGISHHRREGDSTQTSATREIVPFLQASRRGIALAFE